MTGSNGAIYAVRREAYREVDPRFGHDLSFPYLMVQNGYRAVYEPRATGDREHDHRHRGRVPAQGADVRARLAHAVPRADVPPAASGPMYWVELVSHRLLRYWSGPLHVVLLASSALLASTGTVYAVALGVQLAGLALVGISILARGRIRVAADPALLPARDARDRDRARRLPPPRRAGDLGQGRRDEAVTFYERRGKRALDVAGGAVLGVAGAPLMAAAAGAPLAHAGPADPLPPDPGRPRRAASSRSSSSARWCRARRRRAPACGSSPTIRA